MDTVVKMVEVKNVADALREMKDDTTVPKNVKTKLAQVEEMLNSSEDKSIKVNRALDIMVDVSDDINLQPYVRTKIWNIVSMLESL